MKLKNIKKSDIEVYVDLADLEAGTYSLPLKAEVSSGNGLEVILEYSELNVILR